MSLLISLALAASTLVDAATPSVDTSRSAIGPCVVVLGARCGSDTLCLTVYNARPEAIAPVIPGFCGEVPGDVNVVNSQVGMKLVDDPHFGLVPVIPSKTWGKIYPPMEEVENVYTGATSLEPVAEFAIFGRMYKGDFSMKRMAPYIFDQAGGVLHWIFKDAVRGSDCATQYANLNFPGNKAIVFEGECNNSY